MKNGDKVIWDSGNGYEIAIIDSPGVDKHPKNAFWIKTIGGNGCWMIKMKSQLFPYSSELVDKLSDKYGYIKKFNDASK